MSEEAGAKVRAKVEKTEPRVQGVFEDRSDVSLWDCCLVDHGGREVSSWLEHCERQEMVRSSIVKRAKWNMLSQSRPLDMSSHGCKSVRVIEAVLQN